MSKPSAHRLLPFIALGSFLAACSGSGGGGEDFQLTRISLLEGAVWKVNQEIVFTFSDEVDFSTVSLNTINIQTDDGAPATGSFTLRSSNIVVFQPHCPTLDDGSDSGLVAGGVPYKIRVVGRSSGLGNTVRSSGGVPLEVTQVRSFTTDVAGQDAFIDTQQGPPVPVVRAQGSADQNTTRLEIGGDPDNRVYFERDPQQDIVLSVPGFETPLNLYGDPASQVAFVIEFNQALDPRSSNVSTDHLELQFLDVNGDWQPLETSVTLVANCTETGALVRLEPIGLLPEATTIRAVIHAGLSDLVGQQSAAQENFAIAPTRAVQFTHLNPPDQMSDEFPESFDFGGTGALSYEDTEALFETPAADWGGGELTAAFDFEGTGGPGGTFDWLVDDGDTVVFDTDNATIIGADGTSVQVIHDGVVDLRNWTVEANGEVRVQGSKPLVVLATGDVIIRGIVDVSGSDAQDVVIPNRSDITERGGAGGPGGGRGGNANEVNTSSTVRGGFGQGPGSELNGGGQGGETAYAPANHASGKDARRPGGGAGGRFAHTQNGVQAPQNGSPGNSASKGAEPGPTHSAAGGVLSPGPFTGDTSNANNFFGTKAEGSPGSVTGLVRGELPSLWGGYGGGGGGNADPATQFPTPNWTPSSDERGGAGGGGGGGLHIRALGRIQFGANGLIRSNGGRGATGENVFGQDHVGGSGGSGSGGHVILETASFIDFTDGGLATNTPNRDYITAVGGPQVTGPTTSGGNVSFGGAGGPGVIQIHVPDSLGLSDVVLPIAAGDLDVLTAPNANVLIPSFAARSLARSKWISLGAADQDPSGVPSLVRFLFGGTTTTPGLDEGKVLVTGDEVQELPPLLDEDLEGNPNVVVLSDRVTLRVSGNSLTPFLTLTPSGISNDLYLRNPALLEDFVIRLSVATVSQDYTVARAVFTEGGATIGDEHLSLTVVDTGIDLQDFITANTGLGTIHYRLIPRFFVVSTGGVENALPSDSFVRIRFEGTSADANGAPNPVPLIPWTADISQFNTLTAGELQFFRFEVEFELANGGSATADTQPVSLDFLRIPFVF